MPQPMLLTRMKKAASFEAASAILLAEIGRVIQATLAAEQPRRKVIPQPLRASVHLFDKEDWRDIAAVEWTPNRSAELLRSEIRRSSTLWKLIREYAAPLALMTLTRRVDVLRNGGVETFEEKAFEEIAPDATMLRGAATHALAIPLFNDAKAPAAMIAVELRSRASLEEIDWLPCLQNLQGVAMAATKLLLEKTPAHAPGINRTSAQETSPTTGEELDLVACFARLKDHVLLKGPSGVGKTYLAREIHARSGRQGPLVVYAAQSFPDDLQTAYLLGWKKGSFSGATADKTGAIEDAAGGTLFVDEVDKLSLPAQRALLLLTDKNPAYTPLGSTDAKPLPDVRFIFASNVNLRAASEHRLFLHDLYFRINELPISIAPLAQRRNEIPGWCRLLLREIAQEHCTDDQDLSASTCEIADDAIALLANLEWPGNLRQLNSILKRAHARALGSQRAASTPAGNTAVFVRREHVVGAIGLDDVPPSHDVLAKLEALANAIVQQTMIDLQDWTPADETRDEDNPGLANFIRTHDLLFPMVWRMTEKAIGETKRREIARVVGKMRSLAGKNYSQERGAAMNKLEAGIARLAIESRKLK